MAAKLQDAPIDIATQRVFEVPEVKEYWLESEPIAAIAQSLIDRWPKRFGHISVEDVQYYWRKNGGREGRKDRLSGALIPTASSLLMHVLRKGIVVWLAADHVKGLSLTERQVEALIFRQLSRIGKNTKGTPILQGYDFSGFRAELQQYGHWSSELESIANIQLGLGFSDDDEPAEEPRGEGEGPDVAPE